MSPESLNLWPLAVGLFRFYSVFFFLCVFPLSYLAVDLFLSKLFYVFSCNCSVLFCLRSTHLGKSARLVA